MQTLLVLVCLSFSVNGRGLDFKPTVSSAICLDLTRSDFVAVLYSPPRNAFSSNGWEEFIRCSNSTALYCRTNVLLHLQNLWSSLNSTVFEDSPRLEHPTQLQKWIIRHHWSTFL